jgi:uncharacterized BrkB/YihY/UPF0761 family membrane protein
MPVVPMDQEGSHHGHIEKGLDQDINREADGAAGSMVVLLVWVYYSALIVFFGAEFTHAWATRQGPVSPPHAVPGAAPQTKSEVAAEQTSGA